MKVAIELYPFYQKLDANCPESEKNGTGPGSCGGKTSEEDDHPLNSSDSAKKDSYYKTKNAVDVKPLSSTSLSKMSDEDLSNHIKQHVATIEKVSTPGFKELLTFSRDKGKQEIVKALRANQYLMEQEVKTRKYNSPEEVQKRKLDEESLLARASAWTDPTGKPSQSSESTKHKHKTHWRY